MKSCEGLSTNFATIQNTLIVIEIVCRQAIFPKKIPQEISWLNAFLKSFTSRGSSNDRVTIHFENCGLLVKRFTDPIRISITRLGDYNIISIHQMDNIDGWNDRWFDISCTKRHVLPIPARILPPSTNLYLHTTRRKIKSTDG